MENKLSMEEIRLRCLEVAAKTGANIVFDASAVSSKEESDEVVKNREDGIPIPLLCRGRGIKNMVMEIQNNSKEQLFKRADELVEYVMNLNKT